MKMFVLILAILALAFVAMNAGATGQNRSVPIHGYHGMTADTEDDTLTFASPISRFWFATDTAMDLILTQSSGGVITHSMRAGDEWSPDNMSIRRVIFDVTDAATLDFHW